MRRKLICFALGALLSSIGSSPIVTDLALAGTVYWTDKNEPTIWRGDMEGIGLPELLLDWRNEPGQRSEPRGLGLDVAAGQMYWADAGFGMIRRANLDGSEIDDLITGLPFLGDLELDVAAGKMYWAETYNSRIGYADLDGTDDPKYLFSDKTSPYYLELDITGGMMYWGQVDEGGTNTTIYQGRMDGTGQVKKIVTGLNVVRDVGLDLANDMIYYNERNLHQVKRTEIGSEVLEPLFTLPMVDGRVAKPHGMALDLADEMIYWTTTGTDFVMRGKMDGSGNPDVLFTSPGAPWDIELIVPEPSTWVLLIVALTGILAHVLRRRRCSVSRSQDD